MQRPKRITGAVVITIAAGRPDKRRRDVDNLPKAILDLLVSYQLIQDDAKVTSITSRLAGEHKPDPDRATYAADTRHEPDHIWPTRIKPAVLRFVVVAAWHLAPCILVTVMCTSLGVRQRSCIVGQTADAMGGSALRPNAASPRWLGQFWRAAQAYLHRALERTHLPLWGRSYESQTEY